MTDRRRSAGPLVMIPCARLKMKSRAPAERMYLGPYFRSCLRTALALTARGRVRVLSGKYGLLRLGRVIAPYDRRIDRPGAITPGEVAAQARAQGLLGARRVLVLAGQAYSDVALKVWPRAEAPLYRLAGMGRHLARLKELRGDRSGRADG